MTAVATLLGAASIATGVATASWAMSTRTDDGGPLLPEPSASERRNTAGLALVLVLLGVGLLAWAWAP